MAELRDVPEILRRMGPLRFGKRVYLEIGDDNLYTWAAALAYSWLFAVFPFFLVLLTLIPVLPTQWRIDAKEQITNAVKQLPRDAQETILEYVMEHNEGVLTSNARDDERWDQADSIVQIGIREAIFVQRSGH